MEEQIISIFGLNVKMVEDDGNTDSCSECVFDNDKCPVFKGKNICQNADGEYKKHFVMVETPPHLIKILQQYGDYRQKIVIEGVLCIPTDFHDQKGSLLWRYFDMETGNRFYSNCDTKDEAEKMVKKLKLEDNKNAVIGPKAPWLLDGKPIRNKTVDGVAVYIVE